MRRLPTGELPLVTSGSLRDALLLGWQDTLAVANGEKTLEDAREQAITKMRKHAAEPEAPVGLMNAARILDCGPGTLSRRIERGWAFPAPAVVFEGVRGWLATDIAAYRDGEPYSKRDPNGLRGRYLSRADIGRRLGKSEGAVKAAISEKRWQAVPQPTGYLGKRPYWLKGDYDRWRKNERKRARRRKLRSS